MPKAVRIRENTIIIRKKDVVETIANGIKPKEANVNKSHMTLVAVLSPLCGLQFVIH